MIVQDIEQVRQVEAAGFSAWWKQLKGESTSLPLRKSSNLLSCLEKEPKGSFVAEQDGQVIGFIFSRTWGEVGWFGTFAVLPQFQGSGIGKELIAASLDYLHKARLNVIGLETMPDVPNNLGLYLRQGFEARYPTLLLSKQLSATGSEQHGLRIWSSAGDDTRQHWLKDLQAMTGLLPPGFDYSKEILVTQMYAQGETLLLMDGNRVAGMSIVLLASQREGWDAEVASVYVLALHPAHSDAATFHTIISGSEAFAAQHGKQALTIYANARYSWALKQLLGMRYGVGRAMQRMILEGMSEGSLDQDLINLNRWAG
jgi:predicted N-acetyltransferase YhbS